MRVDRWLVALWALLAAGLAGANEVPEYRLKAAFVFNFASFTEWPAEVGPVLGLCIVGTDPFGAEIDALHGKAVGTRALELRRRGLADSLAGCQIVFVGPASVAALPRIAGAVRGQPVLVVADSPGAARQGAVLNLAVQQQRVVFEANLEAARANRLQLSSRLLRLAVEVIQ
jgi:hypothetical protein